MAQLVHGTVHFKAPFPGRLPHWSPAATSNHATAAYGRYKFFLTRRVWSNRLARALVLGVVRLVTSVLVAALAATGIAGLAAVSTRADVPASAASAAPTAKTAVNTKDFAYVPQTLTVAVGQKVTFTNSDAIAHTVTADDKSFDSGNMDGGATWSHVFDKAGTYKYTCAYHAYMHGTIVVQ